jgi:hypothetical protein
LLDVHLLIVWQPLLTLCCPALFLTSAPMIPSRSVMPQISRLRQSASADISPLSKLCELRQLNLVGFGLADVCALSSLQHLSRLEAGLNPLSGGSLRVLGRLPALAHLELGGISQVGAHASNAASGLHDGTTSDVQQATCMMGI